MWTIASSISVATLLAILSTGGGSEPDDLGAHVFRGHASQQRGGSIGRPSPSRRQTLSSLVHGSLVEGGGVQEIKIDGDHANSSDATDNSSIPNSADTSETPTAINSDTIASGEDGGNTVDEEDGAVKEWADRYEEIAKGNAVAESTEAGAGSAVEHPSNSSKGERDDDTAGNAVNDSTESEAGAAANADHPADRTEHGTEEDDVGAQNSMADGPEDGPVNSEPAAQDPAASQLRQWLQRLDTSGSNSGRFEQYAPAFEREFHSLADLALVPDAEGAWEEVVKACGIDAIGDRLRLKRAVEDLANSG